MVNRFQNRALKAFNHRDNLGPSLYSKLDNTQLEAIKTNKISFSQVIKSLTAELTAMNKIDERGVSD